MLVKFYLLKNRRTEPYFLDFKHIGGKTIKKKEDPIRRKKIVKVVEK